MSLHPWMLCWSSVVLWALSLPVGYGFNRNLTAMWMNLTGVVLLFVAAVWVVVTRQTGVSLWVP